MVSDTTVTNRKSESLLKNTYTIQIDGPRTFKSQFYPVLLRYILKKGPFYPVIFNVYSGSPLNPVLFKVYFGSPFYPVLF